MKNIIKIILTICLTISFESLSASDNFKGKITKNSKNKKSIIVKISKKKKFSFEKGENIELTLNKKHKCYGIIKKIKGRKILFNIEQCSNKNKFMKGSRLVLKRFSSEKITKKKRFNIGTDIRMLGQGMAYLAFDYAIHERFLIGADGYTGDTSLSIATDDFSSVEMTLSNAQLRGRYFFSKEVFTDSWIIHVAAGLIKGDIKFKRISDDADFAVSVKGTTFTVGGGYQWNWDNFNITLGLGYLGLSFNTNKAEIDGEVHDLSSLSTTDTYGIMELGYLF
jgi:hypothetical protein